VSSFSTSFGPHFFSSCKKMPPHTRVRDDTKKRRRRYMPALLPPTLSSSSIVFLRLVSSSCINGQLNLFVVLFSLSLFLILFFPCLTSDCSCTVCMPACVCVCIDASRVL
jgi:hypothetical protein